MRSQSSICTSGLVTGAGAEQGSASFFRIEGDVNTRPCPGSTAPSISRGRFARTVAVSSVTEAVAYEARVRLHPPASRSGVVPEAMVENR